MIALKALWGTGVAACGAMSLLAVVAGEATASGVKLCVPVGEGLPAITPIRGVCPKGITLTELGTQGPPGRLGRPVQEPKARQEPPARPVRRA